MSYVTRNLSSNLTSYDFLKFFALALMIVDHIGAYFYPENQWLRMIGRLCVPMWFFLIGYARSRDLSAPIWFGMLILLWSNFIFGFAIFPMNILATIIIVRIVIDVFATRMLLSKYDFFMANLTMVILIWPLSFYFEYGSLGLGLAMAGYFIRNFENIKINKILVMFYFGFIYSVFIVYSFFGYSDYELYSLMKNGQFYFVAVALIFVFILLYNFKDVEYANLTVKLPDYLVLFIQFVGRRSLLIYVVHLCMFKFLSLYLGNISFDNMFYLVWLI